ncbi:hypothetical protein APHAL10511_006879 [Amanita phalloides]|nr:hypothetical protein APHAL10511_006879 [Amanita phalloides]
MTRWINRTVVPPLIHIPSSSVYRFGDTPHKTSAVKPIIQDLQWTVHEDQMWAIVDSGSGGGSGKDAIFKTLLGQLRLFPPPPPPGGLFPLLSLSPSSDPYASISLVSFRHHSGGAGGAFYDFTARYGAMRDDDQRVTLLESMFPRFLEMRMEREGRFRWQREGHSTPDAKKLDESLLTDVEKRHFKDLIEKTGLESLLNVPIVTLSNGQTRRARIVKAVLKRPELLLLDEPLTGLDDKGRSQILALLRDLHVAKKPRVIMGLRAQDDIPDWITHVAFVNKGELQVGEKEKILASVQQHVATERDATHQNRNKSDRDPNTKGKVIVEMQNATVQYEERRVLNKVSWTIRLGERWHLQGSNGSGKSTLLSLLTGAHPLSYTLPHLRLYGQKRSRIPTPLIQSRIGEMSPELFDAFPRRIPGMSVWVVVGTDFEGAFIERGREGVGVPSEEGGLGIGIREEGANELTWDGVNGDKWDEVEKWRIKRCREVLEALGPAAWDHREGPSPLLNPISSVTKEFAHRRFVELSAGEQRVVLVMRALVGRPPLVLLDEALSGMSDGMVKAVKRYISSGGVRNDQALIAISHWQEELPMEPSGLFRLADGIAAVHTV